MTFKMLSAAAVLTVALALPALACQPGMDVPADLGYSDLLPGERSGFDAVFAAETSILREDGLGVDDAFRFARCDNWLSDSSILFVEAMPGVFCEDVCLSWGLTRRPDGIWDIILSAEGSLRFAASFSMGLPDIIASTVGFADVVHKYDGTGFQTELDGLIYGEAFDMPEATSWQEDEYGFVGIARGVPGPAGEAVNAIAAVAEVTGGDVEDMVAGLTDLDGDATPEVVVEGVGAEWCGPEGCHVWIARVKDGTATLIADVIAQGGLEIASTTAYGMRDIIVWSDAGASVLRFDGTHYR